MPTLGARRLLRAGDGRPVCLLVFGNNEGGNNDKTQMALDPLLLGVHGRSCVGQINFANKRLTSFVILRLFAIFCPTQKAAGL